MTFIRYPEQQKARKYPYEAVLLVDDLTNTSDVSSDI